MAGASKTIIKDLKDRLEGLENEMRKLRIQGNSARYDTADDQDGVSDTLKPQPAKDD